jgi:glyoxylase-like metal-dependent hydrolase (beta-lactamase superfamily II)
MKRPILLFLTLYLPILWLSIRPVPAQQPNFEQVEIETIQVSDGIYMLMGEGGNIGVSAGEDTVFLIDDQYAPLTEKIKNAVGAISPKPIQFVFNTHWHGDHTGGNENLGEAGVIIVAHENVRARMSVEQFLEFFGSRVPPAPQAALPVVTFNDRATFHINGQEIHVSHMPPAHTDGDSLIHFRQSNVVHTGDLFTYGQFPFIDIASGGSVEGLITSANRLLELVDADTKIIPGHGPLSDRSRLQEFRDMLVTIRDRIKPMIEADKTLEEVIASRPTREFDQQWGQRFLKPDAFTGLVYTSLKRGD